MSLPFLLEGSSQAAMTDIEPQQVMLPITSVRDAHITDEIGNGLNDKVIHCEEK